MEFKKNRATSFVAVVLIYIFASITGIFIYRLLPYAFWLNLLIADMSATVFVFVFSLALGNASVYDPYWSVQPMVILTAMAHGTQMTLVRMLFLIAVCLWGVRLSANWAYTFHGLDRQDWRYTMLKKTSGREYPLINFIGIHMMPTLVVYSCILPAVFAFKYDAQLNMGSIIFFLLSVVATVWQGTADFQMHKFRKSGKGGFIRTGLWKYSRHPNYLGEILMWWGVALSAVSVMPERWYLIGGAVANTCLFLFISIPLADKHQARKEGFEEYRMQTRMLLPITTKRLKQKSTIEKT